jgi:hypothetical protein
MLVNDEQVDPAVARTGSTAPAPRHTAGVIFSCHG